MPISTEEIIEFLKTLAQDERLEVTVRECVKGGLIIGGASALGGLFFGPVGMAVVGGITSCVTAATCKKFVSLVEIIATMEEDKKEALADSVKQIMNNLDVTDFANFTKLMADDTAVKKQVTAELINFVNKELRLSIEDH